MSERPVSAVQTVLTLLLTFLLVPAAAFAQEDPPSPRAEQFSASLPDEAESKFVTVNGARMHYVEMGEGDPIVFFHGNPTSSYLWRNVISHVAPVGRVIALDLVGFGKSNKPDIGYTYQEHREYVDGFIEALGLKDVTVVGHDWGSVLAIDYAARHEDNVKGVAFMEAIVPPGFPVESWKEMGGSDSLFAQFRTEKVGKKLLIEQNMFVEQLLLNGALTRELSKAEKEAYRAPFENPEDRFPIYMWPNELPIAGEPERNVKLVNRVGQWLRTSTIPKLLLYVRPGSIVSPEDARWMMRNYRNIDAVFVGYGQHYIQEDNPEAIGRNIANWYRQTLQDK